MEALSKEKEFNPWKDAAKQGDIGTKFSIEQKGLNSDEDLANNEKQFLEMVKYETTNPLIAGKLYIFYLSPPTKDEGTRREIVRKHHKEWKKNSTGLIPISYRFVTLKISNGPDKYINGEIAHENDLNDDIAITSTLFGSVREKQFALL